jgi:hypothetical protein
MTKDAPDDRLQIDIRLEYLYNDFLLHRNLFKKTKLASDRIISVSLEIMSALLSLVARTLETQMSKYMVSWNVRGHILAHKLPFYPGTLLDCLYYTALQYRASCCWSSIC